MENIALIGHGYWGKNLERVIKKNKSFNASFYAHYLHHKYFEVNYADGIFPLDKLFGTFHDGTVEGDKIFRERRKILD